jgi:uncharacterized protein (TIGR00369 family)
MTRTQTRGPGADGTAAPPHRGAGPAETTAGAGTAGRGASAREPEASNPTLSSPVSDPALAPATTSAAGTAGAAAETGTRTGAAEGTDASWPTATSAGAEGRDASWLTGTSAGAEAPATGGGAGPDGGARSRTYSWTDPMQVLEQVRGRSGREVLEAMAAGELPPPPIAATLDVESFEVSDEGIAVSARAQEFHYNPIGVVHGGVVATLLDTAAACAVHATLDAGQAYTSLDLTTKFVRPMTLQSGLVRCEGRVLHRGGRTAVAEATLVDESGRLLAHATSTLILLTAPRDRG